MASDHPHSRLQAPLAVCLCGTPVTPQLSGIRQPADQQEIDRLCAALAIDRRLRQAIPDDTVLPDLSAGSTLAREIARLERSCQVIQQRLLPTSTAVTRSRPPSRAAATNGIDTIALELQRAGLLNFRYARRVVRAVRDSWKAALTNGVPIETPLGVLTIRKTPSGRSRIVLEASPDLHFEVVEMDRPKVRNNMSPTASSGQCPRCGSQWFAEHEFRQCADQVYSSSVGGSIVFISDPQAQVAEVCLCGMLFQPKRFPRGRYLQPDKQSFLDSWERAHKYQLLQSEAEERVQKRLRAAVSPEYIEQLSARVEAAEKIIAHLSAELKGRHLKPQRNTV
jgi:hypothetical protein